MNSEAARKSLAFFLCPKKDKIVRAPEMLVDAEHSRAYPDFTWGTLQEFLQKDYKRGDSLTGNVLAQWLQKNKLSGTN